MRLIQYGIIRPNIHNILILPLIRSTPLPVTVPFTSFLDALKAMLRGRVMSKGRNIRSFMVTSAPTPIVRVDCALRLRILRVKCRCNEAKTMKHRGVGHRPMLQSHFQSVEGCYILETIMVDSKISKSDSRHNFKITFRNDETCAATKCRRFLQNENRKVPLQDPHHVNVHDQRKKVACDRAMQVQRYFVPSRQAEFSDGD
jgi:hypothetical protein